MDIKNCLSGKNLDTYKRNKEKWLLTSAVTVFLPFFIAIIFGLVTGTYDILIALSNGDVLILFYSLTISLFYDLWNMPKNKKEEHLELQKSFCLLLAILLSQIALYGAIKSSNDMNVWLSVALNILTIIASYNICNYAMLQMFLYNISEEN